MRTFITELVVINKSQQRSQMSWFLLVETAIKNRLGLRSEIAEPLGKMLLAKTSF